KIYSYYEYKKYVVNYIKKANYYDGLKILQEDAKEYAKEINMKIKGYYLIPLDREFIVIGDGGIYNGEKVYAISLYLYSKDQIDYYSRKVNEGSYITDFKEFNNLKKSDLIYELDDEKLEELYKKVEEKSGKIW
ncbi:hypothetical protein HP397_06610, partial [Streptobacillus felis]